MHQSSIRFALASAFAVPLRSTNTAAITATTRSTTTRPQFLTSSISRSTRSQSNTPMTTATTTFSWNHGARLFSTSASRAKKQQKGAKADKRITMIRYFLHHPTTLMPRPLRFSRDRYLRHWTIHRAWQLFRHKMKTARQMELERQYNAMSAANEELRVAAGDGGRLFRKAQMKTGIWSIPERGGGIPIEYARGMMDWMGTTGGMGRGSAAKVWDSEWKRQ